MAVNSIGKFTFIYVLFALFVGGESNNQWIWTKWTKSFNGKVNKRLRICISGHCARNENEPYAEIRTNCPYPTKKCKWNQTDPAVCLETECNYSKKYQCRGRLSCKRILFYLCEDHYCTGSWGTWEELGECTDNIQLFKRDCVAYSGVTIAAVCRRETEDAGTSTEVSIGNCSSGILNSEAVTTVSNTTMNVNITTGSYGNSSNVSFDWHALIVAGGVATGLIAMSLCVCRPKIELKNCCATKPKLEELPKAINAGVIVPQQPSKKASSTYMEHHFYETLSRIIPSFRRKINIQNNEKLYDEINNSRNDSNMTRITTVTIQVAPVTGAVPQVTDDMLDSNGYMLPQPRTLSDASYITPNFQPIDRSMQSIPPSNEMTNEAFVDECGYLDISTIMK